MAFETINVGLAANDHTGDPIRTGGQKINNNFDRVKRGIASAVTAPSGKLLFADAFTTTSYAFVFSDPLGNTGFTCGTKDTDGIHYTCIESGTIDYIAIAI